MQKRRTEAGLSPQWNCFSSATAPGVGVAHRLADDTRWQADDRAVEIGTEAFAAANRVSLARDKYCSTDCSQLWEHKS